MNRRTEQRRASDAKRRKEKPWRKLYATKQWRMRRAQQLAKTPWCEPCKVRGMSRPANTVNHKQRHGGDRFAFFHGELESVCKQCHDSAIQRAEHEGFRRFIDEDGWPLDPEHPFNRASRE